MALINCEVNLILNWYEEYVPSSNSPAAQATTLKIADTKLCVSVVTLWTQDNAKLFEQLKSGFQRTMNWNKYQSDVMQPQNPYFGYLTNQKLKKLRLYVRPRVVDLSFIVIFYAKTSMWYVLIIWLFFHICYHFSLLLFSKVDLKKSLCTRKPFKNKFIK